jgi:putative membrane protein
MFDPLVHFAFGCLSLPPMLELGARYWSLPRRMALAFALLFVLAIGGLYDIFEWSLTLMLAPDDAGAYNGEQGDMFDAQKDMALAGLGALLAVPFVSQAAWCKGKQA